MIFHLPQFSEKLLVRLEIFLSKMSAKIHIIQLLCVYPTSRLGIIPPYVPHTLNPSQRFLTHSQTQSNVGTRSILLRCR